MNFAKKISALVMVVVLTMTLGVTAFAASSNGATGTITVANVQGSNTYTASKIFDVTYDNNNDTIPLAQGDVADHYAYTIAGNSVWFSTVSAYAGTVDANTGVYSGGGKGLTLTPVAGTAGPIVYVASVTNAFDAANFAETLKSANITDTNAVTLTNGTASNLALGYWFVSTTSGSLCNLTTTNPSQTIYDKNEPLTLEKTVNDADCTAYLGQRLTFTVTATLPDDVTGYDSYTWELSDEMTDGLDFRCVDSIKIGTTTYNTAASLATLAARNGFTYLHDGIDATSATGTPDNGFKFTINLATKDSDGNLVWADILGETVEVTYRAIVTTDAIDDYFDYNTATLEYSDDPNDSASTTELTASIDLYSLNIDLTKVDADDNNVKLAGAEFVLYKMENNIKKYYVVNNVSGYDTVEWVDLGSYSDVNHALADDADFCSVGTSDSNGAINNVFEGLDAGTYYLEEIVAPLGYNLPADPFTVILTKNVDAGTNAVSFTATLNSVSMSVDNNDLTASGTITNASGTLLPSTGGMGTTIFYVLGGVMLVGAAIVMIIRKRMNVK